MLQLRHQHAQQRATRFQQAIIDSATSLKKEWGVLRRLERAIEKERARPHEEPGRQITTEEGGV